MGIEIVEGEKWKAPFKVSTFEAQPGAAHINYKSKTLLFLSFLSSAEETPATMANVVVVGVAASALPSLLPLPLTKPSAFILSHNTLTQRQRLYLNCSQTNHRTTQFPSSLSSSSIRNKGSCCTVLACLPRDSESSGSSSDARPSFSAPSTRLYVSG